MNQYISLLKIPKSGTDMQQYHCAMTNLRPCHYLCWNIEGVDFRLTVQPYKLIPLG